MPGPAALPFALPRSALPPAPGAPASSPAPHLPPLLAPPSLPPLPGPRPRSPSVPGPAGCGPTIAATRPRWAEGQWERGAYWGGGSPFVWSCPESLSDPGPPGPLRPARGSRIALEGCTVPESHRNGGDPAGTRHRPRPLSLGLVTVLRVKPELPSPPRAARATAFMLRTLWELQALASVVMGSKETQGHFLQEVRFQRERG